MLRGLAFLLASFFSLFPLPGRADAEMTRYSYLFGGKNVTALVGKTKDGLRVNDVCLQRLQSCEALKIYQGKSRIAEIRKATPGNYAGAYCELLQGSQLFMHEENRTDDTQFCVFSDLTLIDAHALYQAHFEKIKKSKP
ncbi:MAG: hypothetical protein P4M08_13710 [Oligoflexia bacterium]|nr:hypothetical protein [Oligoflexia bacterium]